MLPSLTPIKLELSAGGRVECGTESDPVPVPRDVRSATRLRAEDTVVLSLSILHQVIAIVERLWDCFGCGEVVEPWAGGLASGTLEVVAGQI